MRPDTKEAFDNVLNTMTGDDGGVKFVYFKRFVEEFDQKAEDGDEAAGQLITLLRRFSKMIDISVKGQTNAQDS